MTEVNPWYYQKKFYQGSILQWGKQNRRLYQGNIDSHNVKSGRLYQGTIHPENYQGKRVGARPIENIPDRNNPYSYYQLPENYYGQKERKTKPHKRVYQEPTQKKKDYPNKDEKKKRKNVEIARKKTPPKKAPAMVSPKPLTDPPRNVVQYQQEPKPITRNVLQHQQEPKPPAVVAIPLEKPKPPTNPPKHVQPQTKPPSRENKRTAKVSPFPSPSPEPEVLQPRKRYESPPRTIRKNEPIFPPILPVTMNDFVNREPQWRQQENLPIRRRRRRSPDNFFGGKDEYMDSLSRSFTNVPGYTAVKSVLRSMDMYY